MHFRKKKIVQVSVAPSRSESRQSKHQKQEASSRKSRHKIFDNLLIINTNTMVMMINTFTMMMMINDHHHYYQQPAEQQAEQPSQQVKDFSFFRET